MSFWDNVKKFAQPYSDDEYDDYDEEEYNDEYEQQEDTASRRERRRTPAPAPAPAPASEAEQSSDEETTPSFGFAPIASTASSSPIPSFGSSITGAAKTPLSKQQVVLFRPGTFNDTSKAADDLRNQRAVIVNMENVDKAMARRVIDFLSGCVYALDGDVKKIAQSAYLFCPHNMDIVGDLETLQAEVESYI